MKVELKSDYSVDDAACVAATGKRISDWFGVLDGQSGIGRRDAVQLLYAQMDKNIWWATTVWVEYEASKLILKKDGRAEGYNICATKTIAAPLAEVFTAFTPEGLAGWFGAVSGSGTLTDESGNEFEPTRVRANKDHRWKWRTAGIEHPTDVDIAFAEKGGKIGITLTHNRIQDRAEADGLRAAWSEALNRLKARLEAKA